MAPKLAVWIEENLPESFAVLALPEAVRRLLRASNAGENLNRQLRRRNAVAGLFPNEASLLRLVTALLMEISEDWKTSKAFLAIENSPNARSGNCPRSKENIVTSPSELETH